MKTVADQIKGRQRKKLKAKAAVTIKSERDKTHEFPVTCDTRPSQGKAGKWCRIPYQV